MIYDSLDILHSVKKELLIYIISVQNTISFYRIVIFAYSLHYFDVQDISYYD